MKIYHLFVSVGKNLFIPHPDTHQKSPLLSWFALVVYILIFLGLQTGLNLIDTYYPGTLGVSAEITPTKIIEYTNQERLKNGLKPVVENQALDTAAMAKAENMFAENYWAHYSPSGKDPWSFIKSSGYRFSYAGENLAKNFNTADDTIKAWMASSSHKDNLLNSHYQEIGVAVVEGVLNGQKTTLVVQMFGTPVSYVAASPEQSQKSQSLILTPVQEDVKPSVINLEKPAQSTKPISVMGSTSLFGENSLSPNLIIKLFATLMVFFIALLLTLDLLILKKRGVFRISSHHLAHLSFLAITGTAIFTSSGGQII